MFRPLSEAFIRRSWYSVLPVLDTTPVSEMTYNVSSGTLNSTIPSWHDAKTPCQESGRMRGSVDSCPHHGLWPVVLPFGCVWPLWSIWWNAPALCRSPSLETSWWHGSLELCGQWERICCVLLNLMPWCMKASSKCASCFGFHFIPVFM